MAMPLVNSLFMPRSPGDRPDVLPDGTINFAFLGQFAEVPRDCLFTVQYSVAGSTQVSRTPFLTGVRCGEPSAA